MKKISKILLVSMLTLAMTLPAFAELEAPKVVDGTPIESLEGGVTGQETTSEAGLELPTINVTLPTTHGFIINPYDIDEAGQIVSAEATITNGSDIPVEVSLKSTSADIKAADPKQKAVLGAVTDKTTNKTVELNLNVTAEDDSIVHAAKTLITGKNGVTKLVTLDKTDGAATLSYDGKTVANPVNNPWTAADEITITSVYTFVPVAE